MADTTTQAAPKLTIRDFQSDQDVRWCPGCGDYSILAQVQRVFPEFPHAKENYVAVSGIGCSSRFPYYMDIYGIHGIHGRAPAIATGVKLANPDLDVWVATGDGDGLSIGGNHMIHMLRRNINIKVILFNNQIYGLTKGQYSPTSVLGQVTKSTPQGVIDYPFVPVSLALGAGATLVARGMDRDPKHLQDVIRRAEAHHGSAFRHPGRQRRLPGARQAARVRQGTGKRDPAERVHARSRLHQGWPVLGQRCPCP